ncbi:MarR family winged helix-turn-helix transcriptional regulator [Saccharomonospora sp. NPDC006951]
MTDPLDAIEKAMVEIRRSQNRGRLNRMARERSAPSLDPTLYALLDVVEAGEPCSIADVTAAMNVDQPRASRLVAQAVGKDLLVRVADQGDGRRVLLRLTASGKRHLKHTHEFRRAVFAEATADWTEEDRSRFAELLTRFVRSYARLG